MTYHYEIGAVRWRRHTGTCDVRAARLKRGWKGFADQLEYHPVTGRKLRRAQWWIRETYTGE